MSRSSSSWGNCSSSRRMIPQALESVGVQHTECIHFLSGLLAATVACELQFGWRLWRGCVGKTVNNTTASSSVCWAEKYTEKKGDTDGRGGISHWEECAASAVPLTYFPPDTKGRKNKSALFKNNDSKNLCITQTRR